MRMRMRMMETTMDNETWEEFGMGVRESSGFLLCKMVGMVKTVHQVWCQEASVRGGGMLGGC